MLTIAITCPPLIGHLNPMLALGRELQRRGHRIVVVNVPDMGAAVRAQGLAFEAIGCADFPLGSVPAWLEELQRRSSGPAVLFTVQMLAKLARVVLHEAPERMRALGIEGLIVDQVEYSGSTVADILGLPYVTVANAFHVDREPGIPSVYTAWRPSSSWLGRLRDRLVFALEERSYGFSMIGRYINQQRQRLGLVPYANERDCYSRLAQLSQTPRAFDFPRACLPSVWHGVGPLRSGAEQVPEFSFERLDGRPLVYASLGSMQGKRRAVFAAIAEACAPLGVQLVITHGNQLRDDEVTGFAGDPLVVPYAPQRALLAKASLVITHAGMNTVLDALHAGVPLVAIPITFEQPAIAARLAWHRVAEVIPHKHASAKRIGAAASRVLADPAYRAAAQRLSRAFAGEGGLLRAADVIERALGTRQPVPALVS